MFLLVAPLVNAQSQLPPTPQAVFGFSPGPDNLLVSYSETAEMLADPDYPPALIFNRALTPEEIQIYGGKPDDPRTDEIGGDVMLQGEPSAAWGLHLIDVAVAMGDLVRLVEKGRPDFGSYRGHHGFFLGVSYIFFCHRNCKNIIWFYFNSIVFYFTDSNFRSLQILELADI